MARGRSGSTRRRRPLAGDAVDEVIAWLSRNQDELVLMHVWDCAGDGCDDKVSEELAARDVAVQTSCDAVATTYAAAFDKGRLATGGSLFVLDGSSCFVDNYNETLACSGTLRKSRLPWGKTDHSPRTYSCWNSSKTASVPTDRLLSWLDANVASAPAAGAGLLWSMQALWQETDQSVVLGTLHRSSLLEDEARSGLNARVAAEVDAGRWDAVNLLEVNSVCDGGPEILAALRRRFGAGNG